MLQEDVVKIHNNSSNTPAAPSLQPFAYVLRKKQIIVWAWDKPEADETFSELQREYFARRASQTDDSKA